MCVTKKQMIETILREDEDGCDHPQVLLAIPPGVYADCEGAVWLTVCDSCGQVLSEGHVYE